MIDPRVILLIAIIFLSLGYLLGYHDAKTTWEKMRKGFATHLHELESRVLGLQRRLSNDPERAAMDHGEIFVINQIETLTREMRHSIDRRREDTDEEAS